MLYLKIDYIAQFVYLTNSFKTTIMRCRSLYLLWIMACCLPACQSGQTHQSERERPAKTSGGTIEPALTISTDTTYLKELFQKGKLLADTLPDSALTIYRRILEISRSAGYFNYTASAYANLAYCLKQKGDFERAEWFLKAGVEYLNYAVAQPGVQKDRHLLKNLYGKLIQFSQWLEMPAEATRYYRAASSLYNLHDPEQLSAHSDLALGLAEAYFQQGRYDSAINLYFRLLPLLKPPGPENYNTLFFTFSGIAASSGRLAKLNLARQYYDSAEALARQFQNTYLLMMASTNRATFYLEEAVFDSAKLYALEGLRLSHQIEPKLDKKLFGWFQNSYTLSAALMQEGQSEEALPYSRLLLKSALDMQSRDQIIQGYYILGSNYLRLNRFEEAVSNLRQGLQLARQSEYREFISMISGQLGMAYAGLGDYEQAYIHKSNYITLKDSFRSKENAARFEELNAKYQILQKDKALAEKQLSIEQQQKLNYIWAGSSLLLALVLAGFIWRRKQKLTIEKLKASLAGEEKERERIAQELHDGIVSKLSIIKTRFSALPPGSPAHEDAYRDVVNQLDQSIREIRSTSHNLLPEPLRHTDLAQILQVYCERINSTSSLEITLQILDSLPNFTDEFKLNLYRIIQELIQNILKHADATTVLVQFSIDEDVLEVTLEDNGSPEAWEKQSAEAGKGSGLQNLHNRIRLLQGRMEVERHAGTSVYLYFPLKPHLKKG